MLAPKPSRTCLSEASVDLPEHLQVPLDMTLPRASYMYVYLSPPSLLSYLWLLSKMSPLMKGSGLLYDLVAFSGQVPLAVKRICLLMQETREMQLWPLGQEDPLE